MNEWLSGLVARLETLPLHGTMQTVEWMVPATQTVHILAIAVVFASSLVLALRVLQVAGTDWAPAQWGKRLHGWIVGGLIVLLLSGTLLIIGEPGRSLPSPVFQTKMTLLVIATPILSLLLSRAGKLGAGASIPMNVRLLAILLLLLWLVIIACGRWIAYS